MPSASFAEEFLSERAWAEVSFLLFLALETVCRFGLNLAR